VQILARHAGSAQLRDATSSLFSGLLPKSRRQAIVEVALRQQLATYAQKRSKPRLTPPDRGE
jgi:hypothetical protein